MAEASPAGSVARTVAEQIRVRPRLAVSVVVGFATLLVLSWTSGPGPRAKRSLVAWDVGAGLYLVLAWRMMLEGGTVEKMRERACEQDDGAIPILGLSVAATGASLGAIAFELVRASGLGGRAKIEALVLAGATIFVSWAFVHTEFALHYAHEFYSDEEPRARACLDFPGEPSPDYLDFLYFSFVIATTSQTADVNIVSRGMRRLALAHGVISFVFNTTLLALSINIAAGLIGASTSPPGAGPVP